MWLVLFLSFMGLVAPVYGNLPIVQAASQLNLELLLNVKPIQATQLSRVHATAALDNGDCSFSCWHKLGNLFHFIGRIPFARTIQAVTNFALRIDQIAGRKCKHFPRF